MRMVNGRKKKWTLMFFFASDNGLSPSMLSQIKAIKSAGFQRDTNVLVYFDPNEKGAPTRFFEINRDAKRGPVRSRIGDCNGPIISSLAGDNLTSNELTALAGKDSNNFARSMGDSPEFDAGTALDTFLSFCREAYPAEQYMLFLVGHGLVVGQDTFMADENPASAISLETFGKHVRKFSDAIRAESSILELIALHSCSMSAIEVMYQLQGTATYMMASQGISFVGAWPYRELLVKVFNAIENDRECLIVADLMTSLHYLCLHGSADFMHAGYSADLCLSKLDSGNVRKLNEPIARLTSALTAGLDDRRGRELIQLAHLKSQSYWGELYTDLYDFCWCLNKSCDQNDRIQESMRGACQAVMAGLTPKPTTTPEGPVVHSDYFGPDTQYSHGLSIFFPWTRPIEDAIESILPNYSKYAFTTELGTRSWVKFLDLYFEKTKRATRGDEDHDDKVDLSATQQEALNVARFSFDFTGVLGHPTHIGDTALMPGKISPPDAGGISYCPLIKNFPRELSMSTGMLDILTRQKEDPPLANSPVAA
jgi:hypothetical protein